MPIDANLSRTIVLTRFPLIALVVMLHSGAAFAACEGGDIAHFFSGVITRIAVPLFFCISGYLLFFNYTLDTYPAKILRRIRTLLIPYLFWNIYYIASFLLLQYFSLGNPDRKPIIEWGLQDFLYSFWDMRHVQGYELASSGVPFHSHLWFLRDLIVMTFLSPFFYYILKYLKGYAVFFSMFMWVLLPFDLLYFMKNESILFFIIGGYLQLYGINILSYQKLYVPSLLITAGCLILMVFVNEYMWILMKIYILAGCFVLFVSLSLIKKAQLMRCLSSLSNSTFFVYGCHGLFVAIISKILIDRIDDNVCSITFSFFISWTFSIIISLLLFFIVKRYFPWLLLVATGKLLKSNQVSTSN